MYSTRKEAAMRRRLILAALLLATLCGAGVCQILRSASPDGNFPAISRRGQRPYSSGERPSSSMT